MRDARRKPVASLRATAIGMLARRDYPRAALEQRLVAGGADPGDVARTLDELERLGYLSDVRFAQMLVAQKADRFGKRAIAQALRERRVDASAAHDALAALNGGDETARAQAVWSRRFRAPPHDQRERARQIRFLMARGYSVQVALAVVGRAVDATTDDGEREADANTDGD